MSRASGVGEGPAPTRDDALLRRQPHAPGLRVNYAVLVDRRPDESTAADFLRNLRRRLVVVGEDETAAGAPAASSTICATTAGDAQTLAQIRDARGQIAAVGGWIRSPMWEIAVTEETCRDVDPQAGLRLVDLRHDDGAPTLQRLEEQAQVPGSPAWAAIGERRHHDSFLGEIVRNEIDNSAAILFDGPALERLYEARRVRITPFEDVFTATQLEHQTSRRERARAALKGWTTQLEITTGILLSVGGLIGASVALLKVLGIA
jgi:hypothetical protein